MHGEFTVEDVSQVGSLSDVLVSELLDVLSRSWKVVQRDYRNGLVYRYVANDIVPELTAFGIFVVLRTDARFSHVHS